MTSLGDHQSRPGAQDDAVREPTAQRFALLFGRPPSTDELRRFRLSHAALVVGVPARTRRRVARLIARC